MHEDEYDYVVVARGFDALWFRHLLDTDTHFRMDEVTRFFDGCTVESAIAENLSLNDFTPKLHLPMLAAIARGPDFPNLSCLDLWETVSWQLMKRTMLYGWPEALCAQSGCQPYYR